MHCNEVIGIKTKILAFYSKFSVNKYNCYMNAIFV